MVIHESLIHLVTSSVWQLNRSMYLLRHHVTETEPPIVTVHLNQLDNKMYVSQDHVDSRMCLIGHHMCHPLCLSLNRLSNRVTEELMAF